MLNGMLLLCPRCGEETDFEADITTGGFELECQSCESHSTPAEIRQVIAAGGVVLPQFADDMGAVTLADPAEFKAAWEPVLAWLEQFPRRN